MSLRYCQHVKVDGTFCQAPPLHGRACRRSGTDNRLLLLRGPKPAGSAATGPEIEPCSVEIRRSVTGYWVPVTGYCS